MTTHPSPTLYLVPREHIAELAWDSLPASRGVRTKAIYTTGEMTAGLLELEPNARELTHLHADGEHHMWVLTGTIRIDDTELQAGSYVHVPAHLTHTVEDAGTGSSAFYVFCPAE